MEDVVEQALVARAQHHRVVRHIVEAAVGAEVPDEQAHRVALARDAAVGPVAAVLRLDKMTIGPRGVGVGDHHVGGDALAAGQLHAGGGGLAVAGLDHDAPHLAVQPHRHIAPFQQADHRAHQRAGAAHRPVHTPLALERMNQAVDAGDRERVAADQQRLQREHHAQPGLTHATGHQRMQAAPAAHLEQIRHRAQQIPQRVVGDRAELEKADVVGELRFLHQPVVAGHIAGRHAADLLAQRIDVVVVVEVAAVVEAHPIERVDWPQVDVVGQPPAAQRPQFFEERRHRDDRGAGIEDEAVLVPLHRAAARGVELLEHGDAIAAAAQADGRRQTAEAAADDDRMRTTRRWHRRRQRRRAQRVVAIAHRLHGAVLRRPQGRSRVGAMTGVAASAGVRIAHCHSVLMLTGSTISQCSITASAISAATSISPAI